MERVNRNQMPTSLKDKIDSLRYELGEFPEFQLAKFKHRIVRRPEMRGRDGLIFGPARATDRHWYLYTVGGDQDQVQLNIGMYRRHMRVGLGFQIGRQVNPKIPAFHLFQTFLGIRPPLPFRDAFLKAMERNRFSIEERGKTIIGKPKELLQRVETFVVPGDEEPTFILLGDIWPEQDAYSKTVGDFRHIFRELMPFYEALILMGGRFEYYD